MEIPTCRVRGIVVAILVGIVGLLFTHVHIQHWFMLITMIIFATYAFSVAGFINALFADSFDDVSIIPTFVLTPLTYLAGVFFSIKRLPPLWYHISLANPILYLVNAFRYSIEGVSDVGVLNGIIGTVVFSIILTIFALWLLRKDYGLKN